MGELTREYLESGYGDVLKEEIRRALIYFGEWDEKRREKTIQSKIHNLWIDLAAIKPSNINVGDEIISGYKLPVAWTDEEENIIKDGAEYIHEAVLYLYLVVDKDQMCYVLEDYDCYHKKGTDFRGDIYKINSYRKVELEEINKEGFHFCMF